MAYLVEDSSKYGISQTRNGATNNIAEYEAIIFALKEITGIDEILSDSLLAVNQLNHKWNLRDPELRKLAVEIWNLAKGKVKFTWIPREENLAGKILG